MFDISDTVKTLLKPEKVCVDNWAFRVHYRATVLVLLIFSLLVTSRQYIGDPIDCLVDPAIPPDIMDTYCWVHATYTLPSTLDAKIGVDVPHPGVAPFTSPNDKLKYHNYYQWVYFVLFFQSLFFYIPKYLWTIWEDGRMKMLVMDLNCPILEEDKMCRGKKLILDYFICNFKHHNFYAARFIFCEILNFINVLAQVYFIDVFLDNEFTTYGSDVIRMTEQDPMYRRDPMAKVFPKVTKCTFNLYGPSGNVQSFDGLCILPLNIVNEKIYVFLWFWFIFVTAVSVFAILYRVATVCVSCLRRYLLHCKCRHADPRHIKVISRKCQFGDWFILYQLGKNIDSVIYMELIEEIASRLDGKEGVH